MLKAIKIRIYPTAEQIDFINKQLGCCRFVYNNCLAFRKDSYQNEHASVNSSEAVKHITDLKKNYEWLKDVHSKVLQQSVRDMNQAYDNFFKFHKGFPKFKSKHDNRQSCRFPKDAFIGVRGNRIDLIKVLKDIHFKCSRNDERYLNRNQEKVKSITLTKEPCGKFYLSVLIDKPLRQISQSQNMVGLDLGVKDFAVTSDGQVIENLHFKKKGRKQVEKISTSDKQKGDWEQKQGEGKIPLC